MNRPAIAAKCAVVALLLGALPAMAAQTNDAKPMKLKAVVELFTSQGCSSCPPADRLLEGYVKDDSVIALSLNVDYWDNLGWKDTLASPRNTERQRDYARARGDGQVYTPQVVINGRTHAVGSSKSGIDRAIASTYADFARAQVPLRMWAKDGNLVIQAGAAPAGSTAKSATIWLATIRKSVSIPIQRGENRGRKVTYHNVVKDMTTVGMWDGTPMTIRLAGHAIMRGGADSCIVLLQQGKAGPIIGGAEIGSW